MRTYSKDIKSTYHKFQSPPPRNFSQEKRLQELHTLKESEVKVGIYKYSSDEILGKGYSSKVYKGVQIENVNKRYAIKVIELKKFRGSNLEMLDAEIEIHKHLVNENILRLYQVIKTPYFYYLILQYCPHGNLHEYIRQKKKLTQSNAIDIMDQIISGYKYLIEQGVIHRDLKPANVLRVGNKWKISDFGFAVKSKYGFKDRLNVGTPLYMSPESLKKSYYSSKADIYSLGIILFQMVQGKTPYESSNEKELLQKLNNEVVIPETIKNVKIREFIFQCCQLNENKRMSREEFLEFQIKGDRPATANSNADKEKEKDKEKDKDRGSIITNSVQASNLKSPRPSSMVSEPSTNPTGLKNTEDYIKLNTEIITAEFLLAKHIYSCLKNVDCFLVEPQTRQIFILALYKLLLRMSRTLCDKKINNFNLKHWNEYIQTKTYLRLYQEIAQYGELFEKDYLEQIKHNDIKIIRAVNRKFPDLSHNAPISQKFYESLKYYMVAIIREHNHELMLKYIKIQQIHQLEANAEKEAKDVDKSKTSNLQILPESRSELKSSQQKVADISRMDRLELSDMSTKEVIVNDKIQALDSLYTIYRIADQRSQPQNKGVLMEKLNVVSNYAESTLNRNDYLDLRRLLRSI